MRHRRNQCWRCFYQFAEPAAGWHSPRMTSAARFEFDSIVHDQSSVHRLVAQLDRRIDVLGRSLAALPVAEPPPIPKVEPAPVIPPAAGAAVGEAASFPYSAPPPAPAPKPTPAPPPLIPPRAVGPAESIEMKLGTYWLARIGIVILLTGFVFLGNYAYHHIVPHLGAWGKLALLGLAGAALGGAGAWLERGREAMRNYARVLLAGGAATFYYTAYAAHFVTALRVIESPVLGGGLLLALAGGFLWFAERRRSQSLALSAVLLSYYTAAINPIGSFSLFSNLLLTAVAVALLVRHRWTAISFVSLAATYGSFGFWRFHALAATGESGVGEFGLALAFLAGYWLLFTAAVFLSHRDALPPAQRTAFLTSNNGALFAYAAQHFSAHRPEAFWLFALGYGAVLLVLAAFAARRRPDEPALDGAYLAQGLALVALGCAAKLSGPQLATVFAVESAVLLTLSRARHRWLYEIAAGLTALAAFGLALNAIEKNPALTISLGGTVALLLLGDAWWVKHLRGEMAALKVSGRALGFAVPGLLLAGVVIWKSVPEPWQPTAFALAALACAGSVRAVRLPEIVLPGQAFLFIAVSTFVVQQFAAAPDPAWSPLPLLGIALVLTHWWQRQRDLALGTESAVLLQLTGAAGAVATGVCWMHTIYDGDAWIVAMSAAAFGSLLYGTVTRAWAVALVGQLCTVLAVSALVSGVVFQRAGSHAALAPIANLAMTALFFSRAAGRRFPVSSSLVSFAELALVYRVAAAGLLAVWGFAFVENGWLTVFFAGLGAVQIFGGAVRRDRERSITGLVFAGVALAIFWTPVGASVAWRDLFAILALPASLRIGRRWAGETALPGKVGTGLVAVALASGWLWVTRWTVAHEYGSGLTVAWALLALVVFVAGLALRERVYRVGGFAILALAVGRIFVVDVWALETLYRILSFLVLGAVLLVLGYLYNRFADSIRRWL